MVSIDALRALATATNSLRYNPEIDPDAAAAYEQILVNLRDELCQEKAEMTDPPLTLEELREMDGEPVWVFPVDGFDLIPANYLVNASEEMVVDKSGDWLDFEDYSKTWLAYRRKSANKRGGVIKCL